jgi:hypothetical protein
LPLDTVLKYLFFWNFVIFFICLIRFHLGKFAVSTVEFEATFSRSLANNGGINFNAMEKKEANKIKTFMA